MLWHPISISIAALDFTILILLLKAGITSLRVVQNWQPKSSDITQLHLEREVESADIMVQWAFALTAINTLINPMTPKAPEDNQARFLKPWKNFLCIKYEANRASPIEIWTPVLLGLSIKLNPKHIPISR